MHPSKDIIGDEGKELEDVNIVLCVTGSVAVIRAPELVRSLMRHGAEVRVVMSESSMDLVTPDLMHWASGNEVVTELTGRIEHVELGKWADIVLVAPATGNTIGKISSGIDDTPPTSVVSVSQGLDKTTIIVPAMHRSMYSHGIIKENLQKLKKEGIHLLEPIISEDKAKIPKTKDILNFILGISNHGKDLEDKKVLVTAGPTIEKLDPVRFLTNSSSGKMGISIAQMAYARGAEVTLVYGPGTEEEPHGIDTIRVEDTEDMLGAVLDELEEDYDFVVSAAAPQDFSPSDYSEEKIRRSGSIELEFLSTPDILENVKEVSSESFIVGFKAECDVTDEELLKAAEEKLDGKELDLVVANDLERESAGFESDMNEVIFVTSSDDWKVSASKSEIANEILDVFSEEY